MNAAPGGYPIVMPDGSVPDLPSQGSPAAPTTPEPASKKALDKLPFVLVHLLPLGAFWSGVTVEAVVCCIALYFVRIFGVTGGYHRYFSHRTYKTSRVFQFLLAFLAQTSSQKGALWWASHHRRHHRYSDQERDPHSPVLRGFWYSHVGWLYDGTEETEWHRIKDFARYPELVWLNRNWALPPILLGFTVWWFLGWPGLFIGFALSTVLTWHGTFLINSLAHVVGSRRYPTDDDSRNNWFLALLTLGEGWHNNHHHYQSSARNGFFWWEVDGTYYVLKALSWVGLVWDLRPVPEHIKRGDAKPTPAERQAARAAAAERAEAAAG
ncbi:MAG TPA: acyl-CoA desaturase [Polyangiaceae bacterium LLY-WYZ-14_1]|nr:acyl-CoA desaturase [Polyangiaceae bacterium LLY-WYZ-14_1]